MQGIAGLVAWLNLFKVQRRSRAACEAGKPSTPTLPQAAHGES
jgi:hypothetical protein